MDQSESDEEFDTFTDLLLGSDLHSKMKDTLLPKKGIPERWKVGEETEVRIVERKRRGGMVVEDGEVGRVPLSKISRTVMDEAVDDVGEEKDEGSDAR